MKERSEKKMESSIMKENCLRIPNITRNLYLSIFVLEIIAIGETGSEDCGASWGSWSSVILAIGLNCVIG